MKEPSQQNEEVRVLPVVMIAIEITSALDGETIIISDRFKREERKDEKFIMMMIIILYSPIYEEKIQIQIVGSILSMWSAETTGEGEEELGKALLRIHHLLH